MTSRILGIATAHPEHAMSQDQAVDLARELCDLDPRQTRALRTLYRRSGVRNRFTVVPHADAFHLAGAADADAFQPGTTTIVRRGPATAQRMGLYQQHAPCLACRASAAALDVAQLAASEVTHLVTVSCTGFSAPGVDIELMRRLRLPGTTQRIHVGFMGCHGAINGLRTAGAITAGDPAAKVLLCAVECCSLHYRFDPEEVTSVANALFADGAAAVVCAAGEAAGVGDDRPTDVAARLIATGSCLLPDATEEMSWSIGDYGFEMELSARVPDVIERHLAVWLTDWLARYDVAIDAVDAWAIHPGGPRILAATQSALGLDREAVQASYDVLERYGNMSSPTVLFLLQRLLPRSSGPTVALAFGPGLVAEAALFR